MGVWKNGLSLVRAIYPNGLAGLVDKKTLLRRRCNSHVRHASTFERVCRYRHPDYGLAWPLVVGSVVLTYRKELAALLGVFTSKLSSAQSFKLGPVEVNGLLDAAAQETRAALGTTPFPQPDIPQTQVDSSEKLNEQLKSSGVAYSERLSTVSARLAELAADYDRIRAERPAGDDRTRSMNEIAGLMRTFALPAIPLLPQLVASASPGERLAAVAILQVRSMPSYLPWLQNRFVQETQAFLLYNTALVLRRLARMPDAKNRPELAEAIAFALDRVLAYRDGPRDSNTLDILEDAQAFLS